MTLDEIKHLSNKELLDLYSLYVKIDHYDPFPLWGRQQESKFCIKVADHYDLYEIMLHRLEKNNG